MTVAHRCSSSSIGMAFASACFRVGFEVISIIEIVIAVAYNDIIQLINHVLQFSTFMCFSGCYAKHVSFSERRS